MQFQKISEIAQQLKATNKINSFEKGNQIQEVYIEFPYILNIFMQTEAPPAPALGIQTC